MGGGEAKGEMGHRMLEESLHLLGPPLPTWRCDF